MKRKKCFIASRNPIFSDGIKTALGKIDSSMIFITGFSRQELLTKIDRTEEQLIIADRFYFGVNIEKELKEVFNASPDVRIFFVIYGNCEKQFAYRLFRQEVNGIIPHFEDKEMFVKIMRNVLCGKNYFPPEIQEGIQHREHLFTKEYSSPVTDREIYVIRNVASGYSIKEIGGLMNLAPGTVASHLYKIRKKLGAKSNTDAVRIALIDGILPGMEVPEE